MPGITSQNALFSAIAAGRQFKLLWNKNFLPTTAAVAGEWHSLSRGGGNPAADSLYNTGTNLAFQATTDQTAGANGIRHGGNVQDLGYYKQLVFGSAWSAAATTMPAVAALIDIIGFYRVTSVTTTTAQATTNTLGQTNNMTAVDASNDYVDHTAYNLLDRTRVRLTTSGTLPAGLATATDYYIIKVSDTRCKFASSYSNAVAGTAINITDAGTGTHTINWLLPRYTNGDGVQAYFVNTNATALGAATPNLSLGYTNSTGTASRATPTTLPIGKTAASNGLILYSGTGSGKYGPAVPLQGADQGIAEINTIQNATSYVSGEYSVVLYKEIELFPMTTLGVVGERDFMNAIPSGPRIYDGANLHVLLNSGANTPTNSAFYGYLNFVWS